MEEQLDNICPVCGSERTLFGNKQIKDGIICRNCAKKMSPWLKDEDIAELTAEQVKEHIAYREENAKKLEEFRETASVGSYEKISYDGEHGWVIFTRRTNLKKENPDIIPIGQIRGAKRSVRRQPEGNGLINVYYTVEVDSPYFREADFRVNPFPGIRKVSGDYTQALSDVKEYNKFFRALKEQKKEPEEDEPLIRYEESDYYD